MMMLLLPNDDEHIDMIFGDKYDPIVNDDYYLTLNVLLFYHCYA